MSNQVTDLNIITAATVMIMALNTPISSGAADGSMRRRPDGDTRMMINTTKIDRYSLYFVPKQAIKCLAPDRYCLILFMLLFF